MAGTTSWCCSIWFLCCCKHDSATPATEIYIMLKETLPCIQGYLDYKTKIGEPWPWIIIDLLIFVPVVGSPAYATRVSRRELLTHTRSFLRSFFKVFNWSLNLTSCFETKLRGTHAIHGGYVTCCKTSLPWAGITYDMNTFCFKK